MLMGPSDMYGDLDLEDVDGFEGLQPEDGREIAPGSLFDRDEVRTFEEDFEEEMDEVDEDEYYQEDSQEYDDLDDYDEENDPDLMDPLFDPEAEL